VLPPRNLGEQPTLVFSKQADRILKMRMKRAEKEARLGEHGIFSGKGIRKKYISRVKFASARERQKNGTFKPKTNVWFVLYFSSKKLFAITFVWIKWIQNLFI
jgi:hypothetical protein